MSGKYWVPTREPYIIACRNQLLNLAICVGFNTIILDDMNLNPKDFDYVSTAIDKVNEIIKDTKNQYKIEFKDFTNVPLDICIKRDSKRENPLGEKVIRDIFNKYQTMYNLKETSNE